VRSRLYSVQVGTVYKDGAKDLVWKLKLDGARAAAEIIAQQLSVLVGRPSPGTLVVPVPTATGRQRQRGYDQAKLLARELSRKSRLPYRDCLARSGQTHQHGLSRRDRLHQLVGSFRVTHAQALQGAYVILIDDVVTTGATLEAAAEALHVAGAARVEAAVFACP
jgi:ComF family protein